MSEEIDTVDIEEMYEERINDLFKALSELAELSIEPVADISTKAANQSVEVTDPPEAKQAWETIQQVFREYIEQNDELESRQVGGPCDTDSDLSTPLVINGPPWQGDHISMQVEYRYGEGSVHINADHMQCPPNQIYPAYQGPADELTQTEIDNLHEQAIEDVIELSN